MTARARERGVTLVEVLVAVAVLAIALIAIFRTLDAQTRNTAALADRMFAHWAALNAMEELRLTGLPPAHGAEEVELGGIVWTVTVRSEPASHGLTRVEISSTARGRPGAVLVGFLPPDPEETE